MLGNKLEIESSRNLATRPALFRDTNADPKRQKNRSPLLSFSLAQDTVLATVPWSLEPFFSTTGTRSRGRRAKTQLSRGRQGPGRGRTSNLFRRQSAAKLLGFNPEDLPLGTKYSGSFLPCPLFRSKATARERWPLFVKRYQGAGNRLSRGLHPASFSTRQGILKFRRISVVSCVHRDAATRRDVSRISRPHLLSLTQFFFSPYLRLSLA